MVKGITRQVILVKSPDPRLFEEAIFIVKEEALAREGVSADRVLREARQAADGYLKQGKTWNRRLERLPSLAWGALSLGLRYWVHPTLAPWLARIPPPVGWSALTCVVADGLLTAVLLRRTGDITCLRWQRRTTAG